jgi:hypothetical protein
MGRRRATPTTPQILKDSDLAAVMSRVDQLMYRYAAATLTPPMKRDVLIHAMFDQHVIDVMTEAKPLANYIADRESYAVARAVKLNIDFEYGVFRMIPPKAELFVDGKMGFEPMAALIEQARDVYMSFQKITALLRWFNKNATASAVRYYWPPILQLAGDRGPFRELQDMPSRYNEPLGIGQWLPVLRDTTTTMGMAMLIPEDIKPKSRTEMWLTFEGVIVKNDVVPNYQTATINLNL